MAYALLADLVMSAHFAFIAFVAVGGLAVLRWPTLAWVHVPAAGYGAAISFLQWTCPLTPVEWRLRLLAGQEGYEGGFIAHYLGQLIYPTLPASMFPLLGTAVVAGNALVYASAWRRSRRRATRKIVDTATDPV